MNALARGEENVGPPLYAGTETELIRLLDAFRAFKESVDRVSRLRRTAEAAARTIRSTFRTMNEGIALFDPTGRPITMNRRIIELMRQTGSSRKMSLRRFVGTVPEIDPLLMPTEKESGSLVERQMLRHRFVDDQVVEISASRQPDGGVVLLARDVTALDRQEIEAARAQRLDVVMRMTHQVSHEVGNMIGIITGSLGLLEREAGFTERQKRHLGRIRKAAERGRALASSMLSVGSQQQIRPASIDIATILQGMADVLEMAIGTRNRLELELAANLPTLSLDPALLEQSILNLCLNASAAMPNGGTVRIETRARQTRSPSQLSTKVSVCRPKSSTKRWSPTSPRGRKPEDLASGSPWSMGSSASLVVKSESPLVWVKAHASSFVSFRRSPMHRCGRLNTSGSELPNEGL